MSTADSGPGKGRNLLEEHLPVRIVAVMICVLVSGFWEGGRVVNAIQKSWDANAAHVDSLAQAVTSLSNALAEQKRDTDGKEGILKADQDSLRRELDQLASLVTTEHDQTQARVDALAQTTKEQIDGLAANQGNTLRDLSIIKCQLLHRC